MVSCHQNSSALSTISVSITFFILTKGTSSSIVWLLHPPSLPQYQSGELGGRIHFSAHRKCAAWWYTTWAKSRQTDTPLLVAGWLTWPRGPAFNWKLICLRIPTAENLPYKHLPTVWKGLGVVSYSESLKISKASHNYQCVLSILSMGKNVTS